jgi:predicted small secreted protein
VAVKEAVMKIMVIVVAMFISSVTAGCNTVQGVGKDLKQGGDAIERAATKK